MTEGQAPIMARKILVYEKKIGRPKKKGVELVIDEIKKRELEGVDPHNRCAQQKGCKKQWITARRDKHTVSKI